MSMSQSVEFSVIRKLQTNQQELETLFFGQMGLLNDNFEDAYFQNLVKQYQYIKTKFQLNNETVLPVQFFKLRPLNFPTIRLSQLAMLYSKHQNLFSLVISSQTVEDFYEVFNVSVSEYWETHYNFKTISIKTKKVLTKAFIDLLIMNTIVPIKFAYAKSLGKSISEELLDIMNKLPAEKNSIVSKFNELKPYKYSAYQSQAFIQLKKLYCDKNKCLQCAVGNALLSE